MARDAEQIAPTEAEITDWFNEATTKAEAEWNSNLVNGRIPELGARVYELVWNDGRVDRKKSTARNLEADDAALITYR